MITSKNPFSFLIVRKVKESGSKKETIGEKGSFNFVQKLFNGRFLIENLFPVIPTSKKKKKREKLRLTSKMARRKGKKK